MPPSVVLVYSLARAKLEVQIKYKLPFEKYISSTL